MTHMLAGQPVVLITEGEAVLLVIFEWHNEAVVDHAIEAYPAHADEIRQQVAALKQEHD